MRESWTHPLRRGLSALLAAAMALPLFPPLIPEARADGAAAVVISEVMASNGTWEDGHAYDWVELHNTTGKAIDLSGWYLSDSKKDPLRWAFPEGTKLKKDGYLLVQCIGDDPSPGEKGVLYADFALSAGKGDQVLLSDADGALVDRMDFPEQYGNISWGLPSGGGEAGFFEEATPGKKNGKTACAARTATPVIETTAGFYEGSVTVTATAPAGSTLRYTTSGATPTAKSKAFPEDGLTLTKTTPLRVKAFREGEVTSATVSATYFIDDPLPVAVVSLVTDEKYLFNKKTGALVKGNGSIPNYDKEWEYPTSIEYFDENGQLVISQMGTFTTAGHSAKQNAQKSIAVYARKAWGEEYFNFNPFPNRDYDKYKALLLRSTNSDAYSERLRDVVFTSLAENLDLCYQDARPMVLFINGEYWGHYNLREKINKYMVAQWEGIDLGQEAAVDAIDVLARTGSDRFVQNGSNADWLELCDFCENRDLNEGDNLTYVTDRLDVDNLFTHASYEIISGNTDITNVRVYRVPGGKWKYLLFDVEASFGSGSDSEITPLEYYIKDVKGTINGFRHEPLNALLKVPEMKARFLTRFAEVLETAFLWPYVESKFAPWEAILEELLPRQNKRWPYLTMKRWRTNVNATKYYARVRPKKIVSMLQKRMKLTDAEVETYFGRVQALLEEQNTVK